MSLTNLTPHAQRVLSFMLRAKQNCPVTPTMPDEKTRILRAKLIFEEAMELIRDGLGVGVGVGVDLDKTDGKDEADFSFTIIE